MEVSNWPDYFPTCESWAEPFWQGLSAGKLMLLCCQNCNRYDYPPVNERCPDCGEPICWHEASESAVLWSWTTFHHVYFDKYPLDPPYTVLIVELEKGIHMLASLSPDIDRDNLSCEMTMRFSPMEIQPGVFIPAFEPVRSK